MILDYPEFIFPLILLYWLIGFLTMVANEDSGGFVENTIMSKKTGSYVVIIGWPVILTITFIFKTIWLIKQLWIDWIQEEK